MKFVYLANGRLGFEILRWLMEREDQPVGLVVHPCERGKFRDQIVEVSRLPKELVLDAPLLRKPQGLAWLQARQPDWLVSVLFGDILKPDTLTVPRLGAVNLHPALLPYNRGAYPNVWSIVDRTPSGVTLHYIDPGVDTGDIIAQVEVPARETDTGASLYARLAEASISLFQAHWPAMRGNGVARIPQTGEGTSHRVADVDHIDRIDPERMYRARDLINILRARTFPPYKGAYLDLGDRRIYLRLELTEEKA